MINKKRSKKNEFRDNKELFKIAREQNKKIKQQISDACRNKVVFQGS